MLVIERVLSIFMGNWVLACVVIHGIAAFTPAVEVSLPVLKYRAWLTVAVVTVGITIANTMLSKSLDVLDAFGIILVLSLPSLMIAADHGRSIFFGQDLGLNHLGDFGAPSNVIVRYGVTQRPLGRAAPLVRVANTARVGAALIPRRMSKGAWRPEAL